MIVGIISDAPHLEGTRRRRLLGATDGGGIEAEQLAVLVIGAHIPRCLLHHNGGDAGVLTILLLRRRRLDGIATVVQRDWVDIGDDDLFPA